MKFKYIFILFWFFLVAVSSYAGENVKFSCNSIKLKHKKMLTTKSRIIVVIHNISSVNLWLSYENLTLEDLEIAPTHLQAQEFMALFLNKKNFKLRCIEEKIGHEQEISCKHMLNICEIYIQNLPKNKYKTKMLSVIDKDESLEQLLEKVKDRGFIWKS